MYTCRSSTNSIYLINYYYYSHFICNTFHYTATCSIEYLFNSSLQFWWRFLSLLCWRRDKFISKQHLSTTLLRMDFLYKPDTRTVWWDSSRNIYRCCNSWSYCRNNLFIDKERENVSTANSGWHRYNYNHYGNARMCPWLKWISYFRLIVKYSELHYSICNYKTYCLFVGLYFQVCS